MDSTTLPVVALDAAAARAQILSLDRPPRVDLPSAIRTALLNGSSTSRVIRGMVRVARAPGRLTGDEYFYYHLDDPTVSMEEACRYVGKRGQALMHTACNDPRWFAVAHDKALFYAAAQGFDLPVPKTLAAFTKSGRVFAEEKLQSEEALSRFLFDPSRYPLFMKPIDGIFSVGALSMLAVNGTRIQLSTGESATVAEVVRFASELGEGYLIQDRLDPDAMLRVAFGDTLPTVRFLVLLSADGPKIESGVIKIPRPSNPADNYWRPGNMLGALDDLGTVKRVVTGVGAALRELRNHPDTGAPLVGLVLPKWRIAVDLCLRAAALFPGIRTQSWDIALAAEGPVVMELNYGGDLNLHQLAHRRGALTESYAEHLKRCGFRGTSLKGFFGLKRQLAVLDT